jgi:hypothetical protein
MPSNLWVIKCSQEIVEYVEVIDGWYNYSKEHGLSRFSIEWGEWSAKMNREIREKIKKEHVETVLLRYIFTYWVNRSQLLELHFKKPIFKGAKKKQLAREGKHLKEIIYSANAPDLTDQAMRAVLMADIRGKRV